MIFYIHILAFSFAFDAQAVGGTAPKNGVVLGVLFALNYRP
jgi:hypothetical protein